LETEKTRTVSTPENEDQVEAVPVLKELLARETGMLKNRRSTNPEHA